MRKLIYFLVLVIIILLVPASIKFANQMVYDLSRMAAAKVQSNHQISKRIKITDVRFETAEFKSLTEIQWTNLSARVEMKHTNDILAAPLYRFSAEDAHLSLSDLLSGKVRLKLSAIHLHPERVEDRPPSSAMPSEGISKGLLTAMIPLDLSSPGNLSDQINAWLINAGRLAIEGRTLAPCNFTGTVVFSFRDQPVRAMINTRREPSGYYALTVNKEFFKTIAWQRNEELTTAETELLSHYPFQLKKLLAIMTQAREKSERYRDQAHIPEDAYRHVLWSYLLTKSFGPDFAKMVTDAHEIGDKTNTEAEHRMDYNNNAIGREYAMNNYKENEILHRLLNDRRVIRKAD